MFIHIFRPPRKRKHDVLHNQQQHLLSNILQIKSSSSTSSPVQETLTQGDCRLEEDRVAYKPIELELSNMPVNSRKAYPSKIFEFVDWCRSRNDGVTVTPAKVANFLEKNVLNREVKKGEKWQGIKVGKSTIEHYVSALTKLHSFQVDYFFVFAMIY